MQPSPSFQEVINSPIFQQRGLGNFSLLQTWRARFDLDSYVPSKFDKAILLMDAEAIKKAFHVMTVVPNQANEMMDIGRLQGFEVCTLAHIDY